MIKLTVALAYPSRKKFAQQYFWVTVLVELLSKRLCPLNCERIHNLFCLQALTLASKRNIQEPDSVIESIAKSTTGIMFLGTPHWGSTFTVFGKVLCYLNFWINSNSTLLDELAPRFRHHKDLNEDFKRVYGKISILNFVEGREEYFGPFPLTKVSRILICKDGEVLTQ